MINKNSAAIGIVDNDVVVLTDKIITLPIKLNQLIKKHVLKVNKTYNV